MNRRAAQGNEQGMVLVTTLIVLSVFLLLGITAVLQTTADLRISSRYKTAKQAFYAAEAGVNGVMDRYLSNPGDFKSRKTAEEMEFSTTRPKASKPGEVAVWWIPSIVYDTAEPPAWVEIRSQGGTVPDTGARAEITVRIRANYHSPFSYGLFGDESVMISGSGYVDSYHSAKGPWSQEGNGRHGDIGTNEAKNGAIRLNGQGTVYGGAIIGLGATPDTDIVVEGHAKITGRRKTALESLNMTPKTDPGGGDDLSESGSMTLSTGTYRLQDSQLNSQRTIEIDGEVTFLINGDVNMADLAEIRIRERGSLTMIVSGNIKLTGQRIVNETGIPANLQIYGTSRCETVNLLGQSDLHAVLYAPVATISVTGQADIYGALAGNRVTVSGQGNVHYDEALKDLSGGNKLSGFRTLWWKDHAIDFN